MLLNVSKPQTIYIKFVGASPSQFVLKEKGGRLYFFRHLAGKFPRIKFNIPDPGEYYSPNNFEITKVVSIETPESYPILPKAERDRWKKAEPRFNPKFSGTARIYSDTGIIELGQAFYKLPKPIQVFLYYHELGHFFYKTEDYCDAYALMNFLRLGYNRSTGFYALSHVLSRSPANIARIRNMFNLIQKTQKTTL
jgi:hypothetical protein